MSAVPKSSLATPTITKKTLWTVFSDDIAASRNARAERTSPVVDGRGERKRRESAWDRVYNEVIVALVTALPHRAPEGICHLAADIADAAAAERQRRQGGAL